VRIPGPFDRSVAPLFPEVSPSDLRRVDGWVDVWFDTDTLFGLGNALLSLGGAIAGFVWAVVAAVTEGITLTSIVVIPIAAAIGGWIAGSLAISAGVVWAIWRLCAWILGLF